MHKIRMNEDSAASCIRVAAVIVVFFIPAYHAHGQTISNPPTSVSPACYQLLHKATVSVDNSLVSDALDEFEKNSCLEKIHLTLSSKSAPSAGPPTIEALSLLLYQQSRKRIGTIATYRFPTKSPTISVGPGGLSTGGKVVGGSGGGAVTTRVPPDKF